LFCLSALAQLSDSRVSALEAARARVAELELTVAKEDAVITDHKKSLKLMKEEYEEKLLVSEVLAVASSGCQTREGCTAGCLL